MIDWSMYLELFMGCAVVKNVQTISNVAIGLQARGIGSLLLAAALCRACMHAQRLLRAPTRRCCSPRLCPLAIPDLAGSTELEQFLGGPAYEARRLSDFDRILVAESDILQFQTILCSQLPLAGQVV